MSCQELLDDIARRRTYTTPPKCSAAVAARTGLPLAVLNLVLPSNKKVAPQRRSTSHHVFVLRRVFVRVPRYVRKCRDDSGTV